MALNSLHQNSFAELQVDAGAAFKNLGLLNGMTAAAFQTLLRSAADNPSKRLGSVDGGFRFSAKADSRQPAVDGLKAGVKGLRIVNKVDVTLSFESRAITPEMWALAIGNANIVDNGTGHKTVTPRFQYEQTSYTDDVTFVGELNDGKSVVAIQLMNVLSTGGAQFQSKNNGEGGFSVVLHAHLNDPWDDTPPYLVHYFTAEGGVV